MMIISIREFYFFQRGKDKAYVIVPLNDVDRFSVNEQLIQTVP